MDKSVKPEHKKVKEYFLAFLIVVLPITIYTHLFFRDDKSYFTIFGVNYVLGTGSNLTVFWMVLLKLIPISLFVICF